MRAGLSLSANKINLCFLDQNISNYLFQQFLENQKLIRLELDRCNDLVAKHPPAMEWASNLTVFENKHHQTIYTETDNCGLEHLGLPVTHRVL